MTHYKLSSTAQSDLVEIRRYTLERRRSNTMDNLLFRTKAIYGITGKQPTARYGIDNG